MQEKLPSPADVLARANLVVLKYMKGLEMTGVLMRIFIFSIVSWLGPLSPFMLVWVVNTLDAALLSWCAIVRRDRAYTVLNVFWVLIGIVGMLRAAGMPR